jgi:hypothetical protein
MTTPTLFRRVVFAAFTAFVIAVVGAAAPRPNIVIFLADDAGWGDHSVNGNTQVRTPNIDSLARRGASLERFYVCPVCSPTRAEMLTGVTHDIAAAQPEVATSLAKAVADWRAELLPKSRDQRPLAVGFKVFPRTPLPARDGVPYGGLKRSASAPNCSYFVNWTNPEDRVTWDIEVNTTGDYEVEILYTCPLADAGSTIELEFNGAKLTGSVTPGWDPPLYHNQDTIARPDAESKMKEFRPLRLRTIRLEKGRGLLTLRATKIPGARVMDLRQINLTLVP